MNFKNKLIIMNKKDLKKFLIENESHTIENTEEKLLSFVKGTMLNRNDVIDQDDQSHHRQEERLRNQLDKQVHEHHHHLEEIEALTGCSNTGLPIGSQKHRPRKTAYQRLFRTR